MTIISRITKGLDLPIQGAPEQSISAGPPVNHVALLADDYVEMKPTMVVAEGDRVRLGQVVFTDKKTPGVQYTAPAAGTVTAINRGAKRKFQSLVIEIDGDEQETFTAYADHNLAQLDRRAVCEQLIASGLWTALRTRPYSRVPALDSVPHAVFVTAIDTNPLAADPAVVLAERQAEFIAGLEVLSTLAEDKVYVCRHAGAEIPGEGKAPAQFHAFEGPHPAGLPGTHIHLLDPVEPVANGVVHRLSGCGRDGAPVHHGPTADGADYLAGWAGRYTASIGAQPVGGFASGAFPGPV